MKNLMLFALTIFSLTNIFAQSDADVFQAYVNADVEAFTTQISTAEANNADQLTIAKLQYASFAAYQKAQDSEGAEAIVNAAEKNAKAYLKDNPKSAEANALLSGIYGLQIGLSPMKGMTLGSKSSRLVEKALKLDSQNGLAHYLQGSSLYYTPRLWGGDVPKAIEHLNKAKAIYEANETTESWEYLAVLAVLGQSYHYQEELQKAASTYNTALTTAPDFGWVKYQLLPALQQDMK